VDNSLFLFYTESGQIRTCSCGCDVWLVAFLNAEPQEPYYVEGHEPIGRSAHAWPRYEEETMTETVAEEKQETLENPLDEWDEATPVLLDDPWSF